MTTTERPGANDPGLPPASDTPWFNAEGMTPDEFAEGFIRHAAARAAAKEHQPDRGRRMTPAMEKYLAAQQAEALAAQTIAEALELMLGSDLAHHRVTQELSSLLVATVTELNQALDRVNLAKVDAA